MAINVNRIVEVTVEMTLNETQAEALLYQLKYGITPPRLPEPGKPNTSIVQDLVQALISKGVK